MEISVIIPTYKPQAYLWKCLDSLFIQTLNKSEYEILIILNGCNEPYQEKIQTYLDNHSVGCNAILLQTDLAGVSNARNIAIDNAKGRFICFIDDDDWISDHYLELLLKANKDFNCIVESNVLDYDEANSTYKDDYLTTVYKTLATKTNDLSVLAARRLLSSSCCKLIPREVIGDVRFNKDFKIGEDALFMAEVSKDILHVRLSEPEAIYYRRLRMDSASRSSVSSRYRIKNALSLCRQYIKIYLSSPTKYSLPFFIHRLMAVAKITIKVTLS
jgi:glycosyltransferase involved in cell wall biosynthesis